MDNFTRPLRVILPSTSVAREILKDAHKIKPNYGVRADRTKAQIDQLQDLWASVDKFKENGVSKTVKFINNIPNIVIVIVTMTKSIPSQPSFNYNNENKIVEDLVFSSQDNNFEIDKYCEK